MELKRKIKVMEYNVENLAINFERNKPVKPIQEHSEEEWQALSAYKPNKPLLKVLGLAEAILDESPDIIGMVEVMGKDTLKNFNEYFLDGQYRVLYSETNSTRGIDLSFLVKKSLSYDFEVVSHNKDKLTLITGEETRWSRGVAELKVKENNVTFLEIFLVHLKSQISNANDLHGREQRRAEVNGLINKINNRADDVGLLVMGDFNGWAGKDKPEEEFSEIYTKGSIKDIHDLKQSSLEDRTTHVFFNFLNEAQPNQLDYIFLNKAAQSKLNLAETYAYRYKCFGYPAPLIRSLIERRALPSDHYPQVCVLEYPG